VPGGFPAPFVFQADLLTVPNVFYEEQDERRVCAKVAASEFGGAFSVLQEEMEEREIEQAGRSGFHG
jgi:hypothetical protein